jgi:hypothetical protein
MEFGMEKEKKKDLKRDSKDFRDAGFSRRLNKDND